MSCNIGSVIDPFYRYKRPLAILRIDKNHTEITNITQIAKSLGRTPILLINSIAHFIGTGVDGNSLLKGIYPNTTIEDAIVKFELLCVCCPSCGNPETELKLSKKGDELKFTCKACGANSRVKCEHKRICKAVSKS